MKVRKGSRSARAAVAVVAALALSLVAMASVAAAKDRNHDGIPDRWERAHNLSLKVNQAKKDQDGDELRNRGEYRSGTDPRDEDSDDDGIEDADEGAGVVSAWDPATGALTIDLFGGSQVSGTVTDDTEIECESDDATEPDDVDEDDLPSAVKRDGSEDEHADEDTHVDEDEHGDEDHSGPGPSGDEGDSDGNECSTADIAVGGTIREASASVTADGLVFTEIELG